ncbi:7-cyano-7-deazaguanine synthase QueC [uncultured Duncaniella sp.]|uniref:7-cyano-7-deazaguanine synthase QueC n=1 Tax=uncultured Duncaniella sp. TaxID=2768039 RepID=UPI00261B79F3|nr:7-cyano-7-deazaguanine synthase QueC [uncultured Duncaniella sp.]
MKSIVLSSGGVDSTTCLTAALLEQVPEDVISVSVNYGQKHDKELKCAEEVALHYNVKHQVLDLSSVFAQSNCALLKTSTDEVKHTSYEAQLAEGHINTYVPFRNGVMLSCLAAFAMSLFPDEEIELWIGVHKDDAAGRAYADCSETFISCMRDAIYEGTYDKVRIRAPFVQANKASIVKFGLAHGTPYELTWSCYEGGEEPCGTCGTCRDRIAAFEANGITDPIMRKW